MADSGGQSGQEGRQRHQFPDTMDVFILIFLVFALIRGVYFSFWPHSGGKGQNSA